MLARIKSEVRKAISSVGYDLHRVDNTQLTGIHLEQDLPLLIGSDSPIVIDVGANKGQRIDLAKGAFGNPRVTSFEPNPELASLLRSNYAGLATIVEAAVGNVEGELDFHIYASDRLSSLRHLKADTPFLNSEEIKPKATIKVPVVTLDEYWRRSGGMNIDLLFIDAQGFDREVLQGAEELLDRGLVGTLVMDIYCADYYKDQDNFLWDVQPWLRRKGYGLVGLYEIIGRGSLITAAAGCFKYTPEDIGVAENARIAKSA